MSSAGILPKELAATNNSKPTLPTAAANVTNPDGTNGNRRKEKISPNAFLPSASTSSLIFGYLSNPFCDTFLKPLRYNQKAIAAPKASPANDNNVPCQKPKKR